MSGGRVLVVAAALAALVLTGCGLAERDDNMVNGKSLFATKCAACHTLARADAQGVVGPNLDEAWQQADKDGLGRSTYEGLVHQQILHPSNDPQIDPQTGEPYPQPMPANLVTGQDAQDVAAYVADVAAKPGEDGGRLAQVGKQQSQEVAQAEGGSLSIPADPSGALAYEFGSAEAPPGQLTIDSQNEATIPHNIALEGGGVDEIGPEVTGGGVSEIEVDLQPGEYTFYCSVPGHREGGMEGTLTVE
ncbi:MAG TPA: c-type cytochrome [Solirubrobacteraceae bacterium]|nr:c-type cytochrome [Solirubrobacteraceae bacterium]